MAIVTTPAAFTERLPVKPAEAAMVTLATVPLSAGAAEGGRLAPPEIFSEVLL